MAKLRVDKIAAPIIEDEFTGSVHFDGTSDYLDIASSTDFAFGTGDFTIEVWVYLNSTTVGAIYSNEVGNSLFLYLDSGNLVVRNYGNTNLFELTGPSLRTWTHIALSRSGTDLRLFFNGEQQGSTVTNSTNWTQNGAEIGAYNDGTQSLNGYISNLRIIKGKALYTAAFTPPTRELGVTPETVLLACQSSTDATADATERHEITANGNATAADANPGLLRRTNISSTITENTGSVYFDGSGDDLQLPDSSDWDFGTGDFTIELFVKADSLSGTRPLLSVRQAGSGGWGIYFASNVVTFYSSSGSVFNYSTSSNSFATTNVWRHVAVTRVGNTFTTYIDGISKGTDTSSNSIDNSANDVLTIGKVWPSGMTYFDGSISGVKIYKGKGLTASEVLQNYNANKGRYE